MNQGKAIVTGAGTGIGQGIAVKLGQSGYDVVVHYNSSAEGALKACDVIRAAGQSAFAVQADLSKKEDLDRFFDEALDLLGGLTLYVNNSGITRKCPFEETSEALFDELVSVNLKSAYFGVQRAANFMAKNNVHGNVVIISSNNALQQRPDVSVYGTLKAALIKMGRHAAIEYAKYGIRVNMIAPGWTVTERTLKQDINETYYGIPLKRWCTPEEIGDMVLFYASDAARSITGNCIAADGGARLLSDKAEKYGL